MICRDNNLTPNISSRQTFSQWWRFIRRSPRFPYIVFYLLLIVGGGWQVYQYWWGLQIQRWLAAGAGSATRVAVFPASWKTKLGWGYLEPLEPITQMTLMNTPKRSGSGPPFVLGPNGVFVHISSAEPLSADDIRRLKWLPFLKTLDIYGEMTPEAWEALAELTQLKTLALLNSPNPGCAHVSKLIRLEKLTLLVNSSTPPSVLRMVAALPWLKTLNLHIPVGQPPSPAMDQLMRELAASRTLARLEARMPNDAALLALTERLPSGELPLSNLTELRLDDSTDSNHETISNAGVANLRNIPNLVHLDVSHSTVDDDGLVALKSIPTLRTRYLVSCRGITDHGADRLAELKGLESLNISNTRLTQAGLLKLGALKRLRSLRLHTHLEVTSEVRQRLPPNCKINSR